MSPTAQSALRLNAVLAGLRAAGEDTRLRLLALLSEGDLTVSDLTDILGQSQPRISRHLKLMVDAGLVSRHREGAWAFFRLAQTGEGAVLGARGVAMRSLDPWTVYTGNPAVVLRKRAFRNAPKPLPHAVRLLD